MDYQKMADDITQGYLNLVLLKIHEKSVDDVVKLVGLADQIADLADMIVTTAEAESLAQRGHSKR